MTTRNRWLQPLIAVLLGLAFLVALSIGGDVGTGLFSLGVMVVIAAGLLLLGGRSDLVRGLRGDGRDEYWHRLDVHATAYAGLALVALVLGMCLWEWAHGRDGRPYTALGAAAGLAYVAAFGVLRRRS